MLLDYLTMKEAGKNGACLIEWLPIIVPQAR